MPSLTQVLAALALAGCSSLQGFGGPVPPLATFTVEATGQLPAGSHDLHVALVWGEQWLTEALCILPPDPAPAACTGTGCAQPADVIAAGCRDPFGFVPQRVEANVAVELGVPAPLDLFTLPAADVLVGDVTARVAYGSLLVYDDRDGNGTLDLARPNRLGSAGGPPMMDQTPTMLPDVVYGASFVTMTAPDQRIAFREGAFLPAAFYPRAGCGDPPPTFSVLSAGGFSPADALAATLAGRLPPEDPASCAEVAPADAVVSIPVQDVVSIPVQDKAALTETACHEPRADSSVRWREPDADPPDFTNRTFACVHLASFGGPPSDVIQLVVTGRSDESCKGLSHYVLKGCREDPNCALPDWEDAPPTWWPCGP